MVRQLPGQLPDLLLVAGELLRGGVVAPRAREQRTLELEQELRQDLQVRCAHLVRVAAGGREGRGAVPADHGVDGVDPGLQLLLVRGLEQVLRPVRRPQSEHELLLGVVPSNRGETVVDPGTNL